MVYVICRAIAALQGRDGASYFVYEFNKGHMYISRYVTVLPLRMDSTRAITILLLLRRVGYVSQAHRERLDGIRHIPFIATIIGSGVSRKRSSSSSMVSVIHRLVVRL